MDINPAISITQQARILTARYRACMFGDFSTLVLLILQAPVIGWLCTIVWGAIETDTRSLYFVMVLSCVWFGCINACREIVKERNILERERLFGLSLNAYVISKIIVLAFIGLFQALLLQITIEWQIALRGNFIIQTLSLWGASLCGVGLGLMVSAITSTQERSVAAVPLLILPQILFSEFVIPKEQYSDTITWIEKIMPVFWSYEVFKEGSLTEPNWLWILFCIIMLLLITIFFSTLVRLLLITQKEI